MQRMTRWWTVRPAQNLKPATYRCPFCDELLPALSEHMLIAPEGDKTKRRHAHTECVLAERRAGRLPLHEDWLATQPPQLGRLRRLLGLTLMPAIRPTSGMSIGSMASEPPSSSARATVASASATAKDTPQNAGTSSGIPGGGPIMPATPRSPSIRTM
jgi:hypothetical protein